MGNICKESNNLIGNQVDLSKENNLHLLKKKSSNIFLEFLVI